MVSTLLNNDNHLINWIKTEIKLQNERNQNGEIEPKRTGSANEKPPKYLFPVNASYYLALKNGPDQK